MINRVDCVIFDCDGVLVDSERVSNEIFAELVTRAGLPTTFDDSVARYMGRSTSECVAEIERELGRPIGFDLAAEYEECMLTRQERDLAAVPGVRELLDELQTMGVPVAVASSGTPAEIRSRLAVTGLAPYFGGHCYSAAMVDRGKPAPDVFLFAADKLGVEPSRCVLVEDSVYGVQGGKAAGMTVIGYAALTRVDVLRNAGADHIATDMSQVLRLI